MAREWTSEWTNSSYHMNGTWYVCTRKRKYMLFSGLKWMATTQFKIRQKLIVTTIASLFPFNFFHVIVTNFYFLVSKEKFYSNSEIQVSKMQCTKFLAVLLLALCIANGFCAKLQEKFRWKEVSFAWPSESAKEDALKTGRYQPENNLPLGLDVWKNKLFITVPRYVSTSYQ